MRLHLVYAYARITQVIMRQLRMNSIENRAVPYRPYHERDNFALSALDMRLIHSKKYQVTILRCSGQTVQKSVKKYKTKSG